MSPQDSLRALAAIATCADVVRYVSPQGKCPQVATKGRQAHVLTAFETGQLRYAAGLIISKKKARLVGRGLHKIDLSQRTRATLNAPNQSGTF